MLILHVDNFINFDLLLQGGVMSYKVDQQHFLLTIKGLRDILNCSRLETIAQKVPRSILAVGGKAWPICVHCYPWLTEGYLRQLGFLPERRFVFSDNASQAEHARRNLSHLKNALNDWPTLMKLVDMRAVIFQVSELEGNFPGENPRVAIITAHQGRPFWIDQHGNISN